MHERVTVRPPLHTLAMQPVTALAFLLLLVASAVAAFAAGMRVGRGAQRVADADRQAAIDAAVRSVLVERGATAASMAVEREHTVAAAVDTAVKVAGSALEARLRSGAQQIDGRAQAF